MTTTAVPNGGGGRNATIAVRIATALVAALLFSPGSARANGRYPAGGQFVFHPTDPNHFIAVTTFGLLESRDGGKTFSWACDPALRLSGTLDPAVAITEGGVTVVTNADGVLTSTDGCTFAISTGLSSGMPPDLTLNRSAPRELFAFKANILPAERFDSQVMHSTDEGRTWTPVGSPLPDDVLPITIDVAPTDARRIYLSARLGSVANYASVVLRSTDAGATFERLGMVPGTAGLRFAYIAAVHPIDPDLIYIRIADPNGTVVLASSDGGTTFNSVFTATGPVLGFAVSGTELALGGPKDGLWVGDAKGTSLQQRSTVGPTCLAFRPDGLYTCADAARDGFSLGILRPSATQFETMFNFATLCPSTACGSDTQVGMVCPAEWKLLAPRLGSTCGLTTGASGAGGAGSGQGGSGGAQAGGAPAVPPEVDTGSCGLGRSKGYTKFPFLLGMLALIALRRFLGRHRNPI